MSYENTFYQNTTFTNQHDHMTNDVSWTYGGPVYDFSDFEDVMQYASDDVYIKQEPDPDYGSLIRSLAPLATKALRSSFAATGSKGCASHFHSPLSNPSCSSRNAVFGHTSHLRHLPSNITQEEMLQILSRYSQDDSNGMPSAISDGCSSASSSSSVSSSSSSRQTSPAANRLDDPRLPCMYPGCTRTFKREYTRSVHMITHEPRERQRFRCSLPGCQEEFSRRHDRFRHEVHMHGLVSEWKCGDCGKFFAKEATLVKHACPMKRQFMSYN